MNGEGTRHKLQEDLFDHMPMGVYVWKILSPRDDRSLRLVYANRAAEKITGIPSRELLGKTVDQCFPELRIQGIPQKILDSVVSPREVDTEGLPEEMRFPGGWYRVWVNRLDGGLAALFFKDITEQRAAEERLDEANRTLAAEVELRRHAEKRISGIAREWTATFDSMSELVALIDLEYRLLRVNRSLASHLGCEPADIVGKRCYEVFHGLDHPWPTCPGKLVMEEKKPLSGEVDDPRMGCPLFVTCSPRFDDKGELVGMVHVARDITEEKRVRDEKETLIAQLQQALANVHTLQGLLPICSFCKKIRDDHGYWRQLESYLHEHAGAEFSHGLCPDCIKKHYPEIDKEG